MPLISDLPANGKILLRNATVPACLTQGLPEDVGWGPDGLVSLDIEINQRRIVSLSPAGTISASISGSVDLDDRMVWPCFVDLHTHIDKGHIWPRRQNPDGTRAGALSSTAKDRVSNWSAADVRARMDFSLRCAYAHGTAAIRTHIDSTPPQHDISWPILSEIRKNWADRMTLQAVCLEPIWGYSDKGFGKEIADMMIEYDGILGAVLNIQENTDSLLDFIIGLAIDRNLALDFHVDEMGDPEARSFDNICQALIRNGYDHPVNVGHCCSLAVRPEIEVRQALDLAVEAGLSVTSLPMCNMFLQGRNTGYTPRWRGVTILHELKNCGIPVAIASDNTRDPFYAFGDLDVAEVFTQAVRIAHLDYPTGDWPMAVTSTPADIMGLSHVGRLSVGGTVDIVIFSARSFSEFLSRPQTDRLVIRQGRKIDTTLPDYRELDVFVGH
ncbi:MAG: Pterin deaminase [Alphaproteobacteria bacterium MarineAlpha11_Bin1]|nr:MAG: Pterin deaminase [Alphaproteobacteria bacterium MarineAlpha11_Bin1]|tara:strand:- start:8512 stop:9834 length:1323 start_codon:yes stop_codon:yes gene_type:complete